MKVSVYTSFEALPERTKEIFGAVSRERWFDSINWFQCLYTTALAGSVQPRIYVVSSDAGETLVGLFCCTRGPTDRELRSLSNYYTMEFGPVDMGGADTRASYLALARHIGAEQPRWHTVSIDYLKPSNPATGALIDALAQTGFSVHRHHQYENWFLDSADTSFDEYFAARPSRLRNTVERKSRKLHKSRRVEFTLYRDPSDDLDRGVRDYVAVYNSSWKRPEPHPMFIPDLARRLAELGCLRLGVLYVDEKPVAAQFWITTQSEACIYKLAYDEAYADMSVGAVLSREMFRIALDVDHAARIDYGVGSEAYKREWMSEVREIFGVRAYSQKSLRGIARIIVARLQVGAKRFVARPRQVGL